MMNFGLSTFRSLLCPFFVASQMLICCGSSYVLDRSLAILPGVLNAAI